MVTLDAGLADVLQLRPVSFAWTDGSDGRVHHGLIAQEVRDILPELIHGDDDGQLGMSCSELVPVLIKAIQEQQAQIEALKDSDGVSIARASAADLDHQPTPGVTIARQSVGLSNGAIYIGSAAAAALTVALLAVAGALLRRGRDA